MSALAVRPMCPDDIGRVVELANALPEAPHWRPEAYQAAIEPTSSPSRHAIVAERVGRVVGFAVTVVVAGEAELESIAVAVDAQRQGVGRLLLAHLTELAQNENLTRMLLEVRASNARAIRLYQAAGWRECGCRKRYYADPEEDAVLMELPLPFAPQPRQL
jgi:ribosomal-protein-alanine N-acetyltransferase